MNRTRTAQRLSLAFAMIAVLACADSPSSPDVVLSAMPGDAASARAPAPAAPRYKLRFITGVDAVSGDGEIQSDWFPDTGVTLNTRSPWKSLVVRGTTLDLVNFTRGRWTAGTCATFVASTTFTIANWDIALPDTTLSYAGRWVGTLAISQTTGTSVSFDGDRVVDVSEPPNRGGIHNVVTNANKPIETRDPDGAWFRLQLRDAALKFGSASTPDGATFPPGAEVACANFTIEARRLDPTSGLPLHE